MLEFFNRYDSFFGFIAVILAIIGLIPQFIRVRKIEVKLRTAILSVALLLIGFILIFRGLSTNNTNSVDSAINSPPAPISVDQQQQHYELGKAFFDSGNYEEAIVELKNILSDSEYYDKSQDLLDSATLSYVDSVLTEVQKNNNQNDYVSSLKQLNYANEFLGFSAEIAVELSETEELYRNSLFEQAAQSYYDSGWESAVSILETGLTWLPEDAEIQVKIDEYRAYEPVYLYNLPTFKGDDWSIYTSVEDNLGVTHYNAVGSSFFDDDIRIYKINGEYKRIEGTLFIRMEEKNSDWGSLFQIYGDDELIYSASIAGGEEPIPFSVDISQVDTLSIYYTWKASATYTDGFAAIGELALYRS